MKFKLFPADPCMLNSPLATASTVDSLSNFKTSNHFAVAWGQDYS